MAERTDVEKSEETKKTVTENDKLLDRKSEIDVIRYISGKIVENESVEKDQLHYRIAKDGLKMRERKAWKRLEKEIDAWQEIKRKEEIKHMLLKKIYHYWSGKEENKRNEEIRREMKEILRYGYKTDTEIKEEETEVDDAREQRKKEMAVSQMTVSEKEFERKENSILELFDRIKDASQDTETNEEDTRLLKTNNIHRLAMDENEREGRRFTIKTQKYVYQIQSDNDEEERKRVLRNLQDQGEYAKQEIVRNEEVIREMRHEYKDRLKKEEHDKGKEILEELGEHEMSLRREIQRSEEHLKQLRYEQSLQKQRDSRTSKSHGRTESLQPTVVIFGGTGTGKSSLGNLLLRKNAFASVSSNKKETGTRIKHDTNNEITVYDVPSKLKNKDKIFMKIIEDLPSPDEKVAFIFTLKFGPILEEEESQIRWMKEQLSDDVLHKRLFVAITHGDEFKGILQQEEARKGKKRQTEPMQLQDLLRKFQESKEFDMFWNGRDELLKICQGRYFLAESKGTRQPLKIVLLGKTGHGKSALGNTILLDKSMFTSKAGFGSVTNDLSMKHNKISGRDVFVIDTPGAMDTKDRKQSMIKMKKALDFGIEGVDAFLIVLRYPTRVTKEEENAISLIGKAFGQKLKQYAIVVFTHGKNFSHDMKTQGIQNTDFKKYILDNESGPLIDLIKSCGKRCLIVENIADELEPESAKILEQIDIMVKINKGERFLAKHLGEEECFPRRSVAIIKGWETSTMVDLTEGQEVLCFRDGRLIWSRIFMFGHSSSEEVNTFLCITTTSKTLIVTQGHHVYVVSQGKMLTKPARNVIQGDKLLVYNKLTKAFEQEEVRQICQKEDKGLFAPITLEGNIVVDGVVASCYVDLVQPRVSHTLLWPLRTLYRISPTALQSVNKMGDDGVPLWARWVINNLL